MWSMLLFLAAIGAVIGWMTNVIAIKLLFRPINPISIPGLPFKFQGLIPKRKTEIARSIGEVVADELVSMEEIIDKLIEGIDRAEVIKMIKVKIVTVANEKMPAMIPSMFKGMIISNVETMIDENGEAIMIELTEKLAHKALEAIDIKEIVEDRINAYDFEKIEEMTIKIAQNELKHIEVLGGLIGFLIGLLQGTIVILFFK
ncbi:DUF445 family protein [Fusibacter paucivorans]|uniref:DUF445 family protein n=1 Tax=Fusibacter paucivorans TaxID=76009 RepID=A0ABS5PKH0_9FIRM|nr:DUF445 family protein [Fusibacter paucivorans]MBS7525665.1 DUF445 family protein [Fusibacter paucivorans]